MFLVAVSGLLRRSTAWVGDLRRSPTGVIEICSLSASLQVVSEENFGALSVFTDFCHSTATAAVDLEVDLAVDLAVDSKMPSAELGCAGF